ncbi:hypothetical protein LOTGIDRAFT_120484 [Lottia gigantea]|uniref:Armadillo repeat-containing domain-containing protein n=1 Tax=Lottia gigantea TaxID=225164 RepID=V4ABY7_LOTGI|nr:hypothetical protein LOTGIDRAFT_120484 [Lottia gigantea]ESO92605.1 hypothetical protein LOTGIDRAFT_120484 [Lottia gigantea]
MFTSTAQLQKRTGPHGIGRFSYLQSLVTEFQDTSDIGIKREVLANLANFAYDPINYDYFRQLNILDLLLDAIEEDDVQLKRFAIGGICNCCLDKQNKTHFLENNVINLAVKCLSSNDIETVLNSITTLMYLVTPQSKKDITKTPIVECMLRFSQSKDKRLSNLASVFVEDYCTPEQISEAEKLQAQLNNQNG